MLGSTKLFSTFAIVMSSIRDECSTQQKQNNSFVFVLSFDKERPKGVSIRDFGPSKFPSFQVHITN